MLFIDTTAGDTAMPIRNKRSWGRWSFYIILLLLSFQSPAQNKYAALNEKVDYPARQANAATVLETLQQQTGYVFTFDRPAMSSILLKDLRLQKTTLGKALQSLEEQAGLSFLIHNKNIAVSRDELPRKKEAAIGGVLRGRVVDYETAEPLSNSTLLLSGAGRTVISDEKGYYIFRDLPAGNFILLTTHVGYQQNRVDNISVNAGKEIVMDIKMQSSNGSLAEVVVTNAGGKTRTVTHTTEKQLINEIRLSNAVVSGISNEQITKMADRNAAEIVRRIPGITVTDDRFIVVRGMNARYNQTYLNGNLAPSTEIYTHAFAFDLLPSPIIDRILIFKSPTPDLVGDVTGGSVKLFTKNAKPVRHFDIGVQLAARTTTTFKEGYTYNGGNLDWIGFDDGLRSHPAKVLPEFAAAYGKEATSQQQRLEAFSPDLQIGKRRMNPDFQAFVNYFDNYRIGQAARLFNFTMINYTNESRIQAVERQSGNLYSQSFGDYGRTTGQNKIAHADQSIEKGRINIMENLLLKFNDRHSVELKNFFLNEGSKNTSVTVSAPNFLPKQDSAQLIRNKDILESFEQRLLYSGNLTGNHHLDQKRRHQLQWNLGFNYYKQNVPDQRNTRFFGQNGSLAAAGANTSSYRDAYLGMINRIFITNQEENYQASIDYSYAVRPSLLLKAGVYGLFKDRHVGRRFYQVNRAGLEGVELSGIENMAPGFRDNFGWNDPNLLLFRPEELNKVWSPAYFRADGKGLAIYDATQPTDSYVADERNNAFYLMGDRHLLHKKLNLVGGLRVEDDRQQLSAAIVQSGAFIPLLVKKPLTAWLPSLNATYTLADSMLVIRGGYGKTLNRPEFREISPFSDYDFMNDVVVTGNPSLVTAKIDNYDLRFEWYPRSHPGEMINAGVFYKKIKNPIEQVRNDQSGEVIFMPTSISYWNADEAVVYGVEAEVRKSLAFIPGRLFRNLSLIINGALIHSRASKTPVGDSSQFSFYSGFHNRPLQGQAPYVLNSGLFYENPGWGLKASVTYNISGTTIYAVSTVSTKEAHGNGVGIGGYPSSQAYIRPNLIELPRHLLDISITQRVFRSLNLKLNIQNLLDEPVRIAEDQDYNNKYKAEKSTGIARGAGGAYEGPLYKGDNLFRSFRTGRYLTISFTYAF